MLRNRQVHLDFHTSGDIDNIAQNFDADKFAQGLKKAHVNSITCFARCHHGYLYYPSKLQPEQLHPHLMQKDLLLQQIEACHKYGIKAPIYTTVQWDGFVAKEHPEWLAVDAEGHYINSQGVEEPHFYYTLCVNSGYRDYFKAHLLDIIDVVGEEKIDGFFMDILFKTECHCHHCVDKMKPLGYNPEVKLDRITYSLHMLDLFKEEITELIHLNAPQATIFYNSSHIGPAMKDSLNAYSHLELESLPSGGWGYMHFPTTVKYARTLNKEILGMTGKFHTYWGDFHSLKNKAALEFECFQMLAMNAGCSIGDQLHPGGKLSEAAYDLIGHVYASVEKKEAYCFGATARTEIGLLTPEEFYRPKDHALGLPPALVGTVRMLQELSYQFDIIDSRTDFDIYDVLILPDDISYSIELHHQLTAYVEKGGKILGSYHSMIDTTGHSETIYQVLYKGLSAYDRAFVMPNEVIGKDLYKEEHVMYEQGVVVEPILANTVMSTIKPYFNRGGDKFCSHQHTPSSGIVGEPAVTYDGHTLYYSHPIFGIYHRYSPSWCKSMVKDGLELLLDHKLVSHNGPSTVITTLNHQEDEARDILHLLHYVTEKKAEKLYTIEDVLPLYNLSLKVFVADKEVKAVTSVTTGVQLPYTREDHYVTFNIDSIIGHEMINIKYD